MERLIVTMQSHVLLPFNTETRDALIENPMLVAGACIHAKRENHQSDLSAAYIS